MDEGPPLLPWKGSLLLFGIYVQSLWTYFYFLQKEKTISLVCLTCLGNLLSQAGL